ncbi:MAG: cache domain-containing protein [Phycisphaerae bacterium]
MVGLAGAWALGWLFRVSFPSTPSAASAADGSGESIRAGTHRRLDEVRVLRRRQLTEYLDRVKTQAGAIRDDGLMRRTFKLLLEYQRICRNGQPTEKLIRATDYIKDDAFRYWLDEYATFYGILFVSADGTVFHTVGRKGYLGRNLLRGEFTDTSLARRLHESPSQAFVDFEYSAVSREPSAFFVEPVYFDGDFSGWFILQCSVNKINNIFARNRRLGDSGEAFLVNENCQMLTDSRFRRDSSILTQHLSPRNIHGKFDEGRGHKIVTDYRGVRAITSFEVCTVMDVKWLLVAKIDEAEVITDHYQHNRARLREPLVAAMRQQAMPTCEPADQPLEAIVVDMDEFRRARRGEKIRTHGVRTCTAVMIYLPGEFAYLGHLSNYDAIYGREGLDVLGQMIDSVKTYEICPYRLRDLRAVIVAPHVQSVDRAIDKLVDKGLFLSQIRFAHDGSARNAAIWHDVSSGRTTIQWNPHKSGESPTYQDPAEGPTVGDVAKTLVDF